MTVTLSGSDTSEATVPTSVSIPANQSSATFTVTMVNDTILDGPQTVTITATATNYAAGSASLQVTDYETLSVSVSVSPISERSGTASGHGDPRQLRSQRAFDGRIGQQRHE